MTKHEETAKRILPCRDPNCAECVPITNQSEHWDTCPAYYRPAVAAALAQAEARGVIMGLERAREIATGFSKPYEIDWWMTKTKKEISAIMCLDVADAIDAEIARAGKEKAPA